jgi:hypothetical protein
MDYELNSYTVHMNCWQGMVFDCWGCYQIVTKPCKFLIIFIKVLVAEIIIIKGILGFTACKCRFLLNG